MLAGRSSSIVRKSDPATEATGPRIPTWPCDVTLREAVASITVRRMLVILNGPLGIGKSTLAEALTERWRVKRSRVETHAMKTPR
jgi:hypothetical protein